MKRWLIAMVGLISITVMVAACAAPAPEKAVTAEEFYRGKTLRYLVPSAPGGGFDTYARAMAPFLQKELGIKTILVENYGSPYAGMNWVFTSAPSDGLTIASTMDMAKVQKNEVFDLGDPVKWKIEQLDLICTFGTDPNRNVVVAPMDSPYNSLWDLVRCKDLIKVGAPTLHGSLGVSSVTMALMLGCENVRLIVGYAGTGDIVTATFRGELTFTATDYATAKGQIEGGLLKVLSAGHTERFRLLPDYPCPDEVRLPGTDLWFDYKIGVTGFARTGLWAPPGVAQDKRDFVQAAAFRMFANPDFQKVNEARGLEIEVVYTGAEAKALFAESTKLCVDNKDLLVSTFRTLAGLK